MNKILSVFEDSGPRREFQTLSSGINVDIAIIGGGITGITAAYLLSRRGKNVAVLEAHHIGKGSTGNSTGNLYATVGNKGMHAIASKFNTDTLKDVIAARSEAVNFIADCIKEHDIDCDFKYVPWCLFSEDDEGDSFIKKEIEAANDAGLPTERDVDFPVSISKGFRVDRQAQFNPYKYVMALADAAEGRNCTIYENTKVTQIDEKDGRTILTTSGGIVTANAAIMATHTPKGIHILQTLLGPYREYAVAVKLNGEYPPDGTYWDYRKSEHYSMRTYDSAKGKVLLVLGETHKVGQKEDNRECFSILENFLRKRFDVASVEYKWAAQQYKPADTLPYIGRSESGSNVYVATGFAADGLTWGTLAAKIITDTIMNVDNKWAELFDSLRHNPMAAAGEFLKENLNVAAQYISDIPFKDDVDEFSEVQSGEGKVITIDGEKYGAFRDESGSLHVVSAVCTHMRCIVNWNKSEKSWDCPCHGSRFHYDGALIEGPAYGDLKTFSDKKNDKS